MDDDHRVALAGVADIVSKVMIQKAFSCEHNGLKRKRDADTTEDSEGEGLAGDDEDGLVFTVDGGEDIVQTQFSDSAIYLIEGGQD